MHTTKGLKWLKFVIFVGSIILDLSSSSAASEDAAASVLPPRRDVVPPVTLIQDLGDKAGELVQIKGWVDNVRDLPKRQFVILRNSAMDRVQLIHEKNERDHELESTISLLTIGSTVQVIGTVVLNPHVKLRGLEVDIQRVDIFSLAAPLPLDDTSTLDTRLNWRFLDLRSPKNRAIFEIQTFIEARMREYWQRNSFIEIHSPKLMGAASESGAELFALRDYFGRQAYLAQSPQFYKQMAMASGFDKVFEIGPVFRANPSFTSRHDTEFTSVDVEIAWIDSHEDVMRLEEDWLRYILIAVEREFGRKIRDVFEIEVKVPEIPFPRITMEEAHRILASLSHPLEKDTDLDTEGERLLGEYILKERGHEFVFVTDYPASVRAFYHMRHQDNPGLTKSFDLLWKGLEVTTGAQREHRRDVLLRQIDEKGLSRELLEHYTDFFRYGCPPHGGYGFGLTRMLMNLLGCKNVREVTYLYRGPNRLFP